jgi:hypothetical protein
MIKRTTKAGLAPELEALQSMEKEYRYVNQAFAKGVEPERTAIMGKKRIGHTTARAAVSHPGTGFEPHANPRFLARVAGSP